MRNPKCSVKAGALLSSTPELKNLIWLANSRAGDSAVQPRQRVSLRHFQEPQEGFLSHSSVDRAPRTASVIDTDSKVRFIVPCNQKFPSSRWPPRDRTSKGSLSRDAGTEAVLSDVTKPTLRRVGAMLTLRAVLIVLASLGATAAAATGSQKVGASPAAVRSGCNAVCSYVCTPCRPQSEPAEVARKGIVAEDWPKTKNHLFTHRIRLYP